MAEVLLSARDISYQRQDKQILSQVNLALEQGQITTIIGPNGAGKSSLIKVLLGLEKPNSGEIKRHAKLRLGYMPQKLQLDANLPLTVERFLAFSGAAKKERQAILAKLNIADLAKALLDKVSGGELQRVLLARALLRKPNLLILDEPVQGVDVAGQDELYKLFSQLRDEFQCGILMVSHDLHLVMTATDQVICLNQHICCSGHPDNVKTDPAYLSLFGQQPPLTSFYTHHHDHQHNLHGDIVTGGCQHD